MATSKKFQEQLVVAYVEAAEYRKLETLGEKVAFLAKEGK